MPAKTKTAAQKRSQRETDQILALLAAWGRLYRPLTDLERHFYWAYLSFLIRRGEGTEEGGELMHLAQQALDRLVALIDQAKPVLDFPAS